MRVLTVDDDPIARTVLREGLEGFGLCEVIATGDGATAKSVLETHIDEIDLVISDINMPDVDGVEFISFLAERKPGCALIIGQWAPQISLFGQRGCLRLQVG